MTSPDPAPSPDTGDDAPEHVDDALRIRRAAHRGSHDRATIDAIVDAALVAHVGTVRDGLPVVIPMFAVRDGDHLLLHGAPAAGTNRRGTTTEVCVTMTLLDGLVMARSAFHHSMNYRSVVVIGEAEVIDDPEEKVAALDCFVERLSPGRTPTLRPMTDKEIRGTTVLRLSLDRASAKVRTGPPIDDDEDMALDIWAGVLPVELRIGAPIPDPALADGIAEPDHITELSDSVR